MNLLRLAMNEMFATE